MSPSTRRAWIEIQTHLLTMRSKEVALHPEGVDRNCRILHFVHNDVRSPSTRRAWIEISAAKGKSNGQRVALHPEGVDRNRHFFRPRPRRSVVALHPEGVDRNQSAPNSASRRPWSPSTRRAWIEIRPSISPANAALSPSTRRAWIEITLRGQEYGLYYKSPSTRRAWIEMRGDRYSVCCYCYVALHPEGVDRNVI